MAVLAVLIDGVVAQRLELQHPEMTIGRRSDCDILIDDASVSSQHARVVARPSPYLSSQTEYHIEDLGSTNGTYLNGSPVQSQRLNHDDELRIAWNTFKFLDAPEIDLERTALILDPITAPD